MLTYYLFRIKAETTYEHTMLESGQQPIEIITNCILQRPSAVLRRGYNWHIGNVTELTNGIYFALGRTTSTTLELFDQSSGDFTEVEYENAPYTHVFFDKLTGALAIATKSRLSPTTKGIAKQLAKLLNSMPISDRHYRNFEIEQIFDPQDFIESLQTAFAINQVAIEIGLPNPFDVNEQFIKPFEQTIEQLSGNKGKATIDGVDLDADVLEDIARTNASIGKDMTATLVPEQGSRKVKKSLATSNPVVITDTDSVSELDKEQFMQKINHEYNTIRRNRR